ncbi:SRPBCC family protein [Henriciella litoralis]|uniref:SRPBCC family protein n=1 Tax=Henriciella litoralis TaxID=568102 RepID=UPI0009FC38AA|nr:SRPBCC family protein [Henriciella litoralis]
MTNQIEKTAEFKASVETVWDAITDHEKFGDWFKVKLYDPFVEGAVTRGQITYPGYEHFKWESRTTVIRPKVYFAFIWYHDNIEAEPGDVRLETLVEFKLKPTGTGTHLTIVESGFDSFPPGKGEQARLSNEGGWEEQMHNIGAFVDG